jgi:hypothetical protein
MCNKLLNRTLESVRNVVNIFGPKSAASIQIAQYVLKDAKLEINLCYISDHPSHLSSAISLLEASNSNTTSILYQWLSVFKTTVSKLKSAPGRVGEVVKEKLHSTFNFIHSGPSH